MGAYDDPQVYEVAFQVDAVNQVNLILGLVNRHSEREVRRVLDVGCGPSPQLLELAGRGYECVGLDVRPGMLAHLRMKAASSGIHVETVEADMTGFTIPRRVDIALCMMGTISLVGSRERMVTHLSSVASCLARGGLYVAENYRLGWSKREMLEPQSWESKGDGFKVRTTYMPRLVDPIAHSLIEGLTLEVDERGEKRIITDEWGSVFFSVEELEGMLEGSGLKLVGLFDHESGEPMREPNNFNYLILRKG